MSIAVEGLIGAGKSTVLRAIRRLVTDVQVFEEPIETWTEVLDNFYTKPREHSFLFGVTVLLGFAKKATLKPPVVIERSPATCRYVFNQTLFNDDLLSAGEWELFKELYDALTMFQPTHIIYIAVPVDTCMERIKKRGRECEKNISADYLRKLEYQYELMLRYAPVPVIRIDGTASQCDIEMKVADAVKDIVSSTNESLGPATIQTRPMTRT
jgi:deoxyguanosine kinase